MPRGYASLIGDLRSQGKLKAVGMCDIMADRGGEESVCSTEWLPEESTIPEGVNFKRFVAACGHEIATYGQRQVKLKRKGEDGQKA